MINLLNKLPDEVSYIREYALKFGRNTEKETFNLIHQIASKEDLNNLAYLDEFILENNHLDILIEFIKDNLESFPEESTKLNSFILAIMAVPGTQI
jgi:hypothetical protein